MDTNWIPVEERLPEPGQWVTVALMNDLPTDMGQKNEVWLARHEPELLDGDDYVSEYSTWVYPNETLCEEDRITHWLPLPKHPEEK